ncbi:Biotin synthase [Ascochyta rabiei]|uniref:biotin synthase n=2 Tax=Didymella rabiei TaxID=5454 RepID=A0A163ITW5_DIDRA|nr:Biotin synthase [Ascochyta rabiei]KZM25944.1 biotin synthase [Ascochyta rabiei]UPX18935.1 Biotin synthase [Ascochyta rabiei]
MAQRILVRPIGLGLSSARTQQFVRPFSTVLDTPIDSETQQVTPPTRKSSVFEDAVRAAGPRTNWTREEIAEVYNTPLIKLTYAAASVHQRFHDPAAIQMCTLMNIKTGGCSEDCSYCAQSSRYDTGLKATKLSSVESVLEAARVAKENGSSRFCMGAAWRDMRGRKTNLKNIKAMITGVREMGMEACVTLGMVDAEQAKELKQAGLTAYNHNVDTSREHYPSVITTRTYDERLKTIQNVQEAGIHVCTGGILGLGEKAKDHVGLVHTVATLPAHPESFPVNALVPIKGTPLGETQSVSFDAILRTIATARLVMPKTIIRLAAGRHTMREEKQIMCFQAGANAIFTGEKMLTTACNGWEEDKAMFERWGLRPMAMEETIGEVRKNENIGIEAVKEAEQAPAAV